MMMQMIKLGGRWAPELWLAQVPIVPAPAPTSPAEASLLFSGPRFFVALISGILLAFAFQFVLTNLSVAAGISYLGHRDEDHSSHASSSGNGHSGNTVRKVGTWLGVWTLITVSLALFVACFLAVRLSLLFLNPGLGAILGLVIWAAYFSLLVWLSSTTVGSVIGSVVSTATSGIQAILGTAAAALGAKTASSQVVSTAEAAAAAVRRELSSGLDVGGLRDRVEDYLDRLRPPELDFGRVRQEFRTLLNDPELQSLAARGDLRHIDRQTFVDLVSARTDFSKREVNRIVDLLQSVWYEVLGQRRDPVSEFRNFLSTARPDQLRSNELNRRLDQLMAEVRQLRDTQSNQTNRALSSLEHLGNNLSQQTKSDEKPSLVDQAMQFGLTTLIGTVMGRTDLSQVDVEEVIQRLRSLIGQLGDRTAQLTGNDDPAASIIRADVENYLLHVYPWELSPATLQREFTDVLYDPEADPATIRHQLETLGRQDFVNILAQRGVFTQDQINGFADRLEDVRQQVLNVVKTAAAEEHLQDLRDRVQHYILTSDKAELTSERIDQDFAHLLSDADTDYEELSYRLNYFDRDRLVQLLRQRPDLTPEEAAQTLVQLETARDRVLFEAQSVRDQMQQRAQALESRLEDYLRRTGRDELDPDTIKRELSLLLDDPQAGLKALGRHAKRFNRDTFVQLLSQRQDLSESDINRVLDQVESSWNRVVHAPQEITGKAREQYDQTLQAIADYLRGTNLPELDPDGIRRDLSRLMDNPREGAVAIRRRLSQVDRQTLVRLLSQRQDLSEEQANRIVNQVQDSLRTVVRSPRRLASRTQQQIRDFQTNLEAYLRNTQKEELNPEGIRRDVQLLFNDPRAGLSSLGDRVSRVDRSTVVSLLSQRSDISEAEANRIVDQVLSVRDQAMQQIQNVQNRIQSVVDNLFARIRNYLNSLERPELNYDGIKRDVRTLFNDPQAGFEALRDRLGHFNRDTLVAILSSREDISEADVNRVLDQIEGARLNVLQRAERLQQDAQRRVEEMKIQAQRQAEETRKAAASASWWLFLTAVTSAIASGLAGAIAGAG